MSFVVTLDDAKKVGIDHFGVISTNEIVFGQEIRDICAGNACRGYGKSWACPPAMGTVEECRERCLSFENALVFSSVYELEDSFDFEGMSRGHAGFKKVCDEFYDMIKPRMEGEFILLSNEGCKRCKTCTYPDAPCRFPERLFPALEGYGIYVNKLAQSAGMKYINGQNTVTYFGMLLYGKKC